MHADRTLLWGFHPGALDLQELQDYIQDVLLKPDAGRKVLAGIAASCAKLKDQPHMGVELRKKLNREIEGDCIFTGKYIVIYDVDEAVSILRVLDTRTDYWKLLLADESGGMKDNGAVSDGESSR